MLPAVAYPIIDTAVQAYKYGEQAKEFYDRAIEARNLYRKWFPGKPTNIPMKRLRYTRPGGIRPSAAISRMVAADLAQYKGMIFVVHKRRAEVETVTFT